MNAKGVCSQIRKAVAKGLGTIREGIKWEIGDDARIDVMEERLIDTVPLSRLTTVEE